MSQLYVHGEKEVSCGSALKYPYVHPGERSLVHLHRTKQKLLGWMDMLDTAEMWRPLPLLGLSVGCQ